MINNASTFLKQVSNKQILIIILMALSFSIIIELMARIYVKSKGYKPIRHKSTPQIMIIIIPLLINFVYLYTEIGQSISEEIILLLIISITGALAYWNTYSIYCFYELEKSGNANMEELNKLK